MDSQYLISRLKRIYDECVSVQEDQREGQYGKSVIDEYNKLLDNLKGDYPGNPVIQDIEPISHSGSIVASGELTRATANDIERVKMNVYAVADSLGVELEDFQKEASASGLPIIEISQSVQMPQEVEIADLIKQVDSLLLKQKQRKELKELIDNFDDELNKNDPDDEHLKNLIEEAERHNRDIALKLGMRALRSGVDVLTG